VIQFVKSLLAFRIEVPFPMSERDDVSLAATMAGRPLDRQQALYVRAAGSSEHRASCALNTNHGISSPSLSMRNHDCAGGNRREPSWRCALTDGALCRLRVTSGCSGTSQKVPQARRMAKPPSGRGAAAHPASSGSAVNRPAATQAAPRRSTSSRGPMAAAIWAGLPVN